MATVTAVRERPILFSGEMVRAILEGRKTQTRRVVKPQPPGWIDSFGYTCFTPEGHISGRGYWKGVPGEGGPGEKFFRCPFGAPGDRLWVRETWAPGWTYMGEYPCVFYRADGTAIIGSESLGLRPYGKSAASPPAGLRWKPSIFMPRWASRITLEVTEVRVERVQEITEEDCIAEGCPADYLLGVNWFRSLWDEINGPRGFGWGQDPWVWVVGFRPLTTTDAESE